MSNMQKTNQMASGLRALRSIQHDQIDGLSDPEQFRADPFKYYIRCNESDLKLIQSALSRKHND